MASSALEGLGEFTWKELVAFGAHSGIALPPLRYLPSGWVVPGRPA